MLMASSSLQLCFSSDEDSLIYRSPDQRLTANKPSLHIGLQQNHLIYCPNMELALGHR